MQRRWCSDPRDGRTQLSRSEHEPADAIGDRMRSWSVVLLSAALLAAPPPAQARIIRLEISHVEPAFGGRVFGMAGSFERLVGRAQGEVDPKAAANTGIQDIGLAPKNARGLVDYSAEIEIIRPADTARSNHVLLFDAVNRGNKDAVALYNADVPGPQPRINASDDPGDGWLQRSGYTVVYFGWQADLLPGDKRLTLQVPAARNADGSPLTGIVRSELVTLVPTTTLNLSSGWFTGMTHASYPVAGIEAAGLLSEGVLPLVDIRPRENAPRMRIPAGQASFADCSSGTPRPDATKICLPAGFQPGMLYDLFYRASDPLVTGLGFAVARDLGAFLKAADKDSVGTPNPVVHGKQVKAIVSGSSQGGRMIRTLLLLGFNKDEAGQRVFDGALTHASAGLLPLNVRFAQPGRAWAQQIDHLYPGTEFPFAFAHQTDPITGRSQGILDRCAADNTCPRIFDVPSALEFWEGGGSLGITDPLGREDLHEPAELRTYLLASAQHTPAPLPLAAAPPFGLCMQQPNPAPHLWTLRALLADLTAWVRDEQPPPPSAVPTIKDATLVAPDEVRFPTIPATAYGGVERPAMRFVGAFNPVHVQDHGTGFKPGEASGLFAFEPPRQGAASYSVLVPQVDDDGIDIAGIRSVYQLAPVGTATGWNLFRPGMFADDGLCTFQGSFIPFAPTRAERRKAGDPRLSVEERYSSGYAYALAMKRSAEILVRKRFMLPEDADRVAAEAEREGGRPAP